MKQYTNAFFSFLNDKGNEVVITFAQDTPSVPSTTEQQNSIPTERTIVAELVMNEDVARNLMQSLAAMFAQYEKDHMNPKE